MTTTQSSAADILDHLMEGCQVIGFDWRYVYVNETAAQHGRRAKEELLGHTMQECYPGIETTPMFALLSKCMTQRTPETMENEFAYPDGSKIWFELRIVAIPVGVFVLSLDITARKAAAEHLRRTEDQLLHAQKMEAVGRLAGGVAHDFNNLLSVILSYSEMVASEVPPDGQMADDLAQIRRAGERAAALTQQLLTFSRQQVVEPTVLNLNEVTLAMDRMLRRVIGEDIELVTVSSPVLGNVKADRGQMDQVLMNLAVNARDAMPTGGKLTIETTDVDLDDSYARDHVGVKPGPYVMLAVSDTGVGMDKPTLARIFEPFFTTKEQGKGTGLGLATVFGIVQQSGGNIWVYSDPDRGTTFKVYLPRVVAFPALKLMPLDLSSAGGTETILLVEDDAQVRSSVHRILTHLGYRVLEAPRPADAIRICQEEKQTIHLLLTDVVMPGMSGPDLVKMLVPMRPEMRVLCMSGYTDEAVMRHGILESGLAFLQKPITPDKLAQKLREVLRS